MDLKEAYVATLKSGIGLDMLEDITCYPTSDGCFSVEYWVHEDNYESLDLTSHQFNLLKDEGQLLEIFDGPEEAIDLFLKLRPKGKYSYEDGRGGNLKETLAAKKKNRFFD